EGRKTRLEKLAALNKGRRSPKLSAKYASLVRLWEVERIKAEIRLLERLAPQAERFHRGAAITVARSPSHSSGLLVRRAVLNTNVREPSSYLSSPALCRDRFRIHPLATWPIPQRRASDLRRLPIEGVDFLASGVAD